MRCKECRRGAPKQWVAIFHVCSCSFFLVLSSLLVFVFVNYTAINQSVEQARLADIERIEAEQEKLVENLLEKEEKELEELRVTIDNVTYVGYEVFVAMLSHVNQTRALSVKGILRVQVVLS